MSMPVFILAAGSGTKLFPFDKVGPKCLRPVANRPLLLRSMEAVRACTDAPIYVAVKPAFRGAVTKCCMEISAAEVFCVEETMGTADTLLALVERYAPEEYLVLYGDTLLDPADLNVLLAAKTPAALVYSAIGDPSAWICCRTEQGRIAAIGAHQRGDGLQERMAAFRLNRALSARLPATPEYFPDMKVGEGAPCERYLEAALFDSLPEQPIAAIEGKGYCFDIDKPWQLMEADAYFRHEACLALTENRLGSGASIDASAQIEGFVSLGENARIGRNVLIQGNVILGDGSAIDNGAMILGEAQIGARTKIRNYAQVYGYSTIGNDCIIDHGAEFLGGMILDKVYLYHTAELYGLVGSYTDIGVGTLCGTLRFDDDRTIQRVKGRRERVATLFDNCSYIGDYCRTGAGVILQPGVKIGAYSVIAPGAIIAKDVPHNTAVKLEQTLSYSEWGPERYGW